MRHEQADRRILQLVERRFHLDKTASHDQRIKTYTHPPSSVWIDAACIGRPSNSNFLFGECPILWSKLTLKVVYHLGQHRNIWFVCTSILEEMSLWQMSLWLRINSAPNSVTPCDYFVPNIMVYSVLYILSRPSEFYRQAVSGVGLQAGSP